MFSRRSLWPRQSLLLGFTGSPRRPRTIKEQLNGDKQLVVHVSTRSEGLSERGAFLTDKVSLAGAANGTLQGLTFTVKDLYDVRLLYQTRFPIKWYQYWSWHELCGAALWERSRAL